MRLALLGLLLVAGCAAEDGALRVPAPDSVLVRRAERGDVDAMVTLGGLLLGDGRTERERGHWVEDDTERDGARWEPGSPPADDQRREAVAWLERAAALGSAPAMLRLGEDALSGHEVVRVPCLRIDAQVVLSSLDAGLSWFRRAGETRDPVAMRALGALLLVRATGRLDHGATRVVVEPPEGSDDPLVVDEALVWIRRSAVAGDEEGRRLLVHVVGSRPDLRAAADSALAPTGASLTDWMTTPWPDARPFRELPPVFPAGGDDAAVRAAKLAAEGRLDEATALALAALQADPRDARAAVALAGCDLQRAVSGVRLNLALVECAIATLRIATGAAPDEPLPFAASAVAEAWSDGADAACRGLAWPVWPVRHSRTAAFLGGGDGLEERIRSWLAARGVAWIADPAHPGERAPWSPEQDVAGRLVARARGKPAAERLAVLLRAFSFQPRSDEVLVQLADVRRELGDVAAADADLARAIELAPPERRSAVLLGRATLRQRAGDLDGAVADLDACIAANPYSPPQETLLRRGLCHWLRGDWTVAIADLEGARAAIWLAGLGADPALRWPAWLKETARTVYVEAWVAMLWLGEITLARLETRCADDRRAGRVTYFIECHLGLHAEHAGALASARAHYAACVASADPASVEALWASARLRALGP